MILATVIYSDQLIKLYEKMIDTMYSNWIVRLWYKWLFFKMSWFFDRIYKVVDKNTIINCINGRVIPVIKKYKYVADFFDCDDFAMHFKILLEDCAKSNAVGIALGIVCSDDNKMCNGHAWVTGIWENGDNIGIFMVESENGNLLMFDNEKRRWRGGNWLYEPLAVII